MDILRTREGVVEVFGVVVDVDVGWRGKVSRWSLNVDLGAKSF